MPNIQSLQSLLWTIDSAPRGHGLFVQRGKLQPSSKSAILDLMETDDPDEDPQFAKDNKLDRFLTISEVKSVLANARDQLSSPTIEDFIAALKFYYNNDAYIDFSDGRSNKRRR